MDSIELRKTDRIRALNDAFRRSFVGGKVMMTRGVATLPESTKVAILDRVRTFDAFNEGDDPYGEHDFGALEVDGERVWFKIDYYDRAMEFGSTNPAEPDVTTRVLTLLLPDEY